MMKSSNGVDSPDSLFSSDEEDRQKHKRQKSIPIIQQREIEQKHFNDRMYPISYHHKRSSVAATPDDGTALLISSEGSPLPLR